MVYFPNAKINLGLNIVSRRPDGYHDLETAFYPVRWRDALEIVQVPEKPDDDSSIRMVQTGFPVDCNASDNICVKAWQLLRREFTALPLISMHLHKAIPTGAGLGGGSSDGAHALRMLNEMFDLGMSDARMEVLALELGSDCPFFIRNRPSFAEGRGERMQDIQLDLSDFGLLIVHPGIHVSTAKAFGDVRPAVPDSPIPEVLSLPPAQWRGRLCNDFEPSVFAAFPTISIIKDILYDQGALYASMSGSGSSVYGIFPKGGLPNQTLGFPETYKIFRQECMSPSIGHDSLSSGR